MKITKVIHSQTTAEVTEGCFQCPYEGKEQEMNATLHYCTHPESPAGYAGCVPYKGFPKWCPFGLGKDSADNT